MKIIEKNSCYYLRTERDPAARPISNFTLSIERVDIELNPNADNFGTIRRWVKFHDSPILHQMFGGELVSAERFRGYCLNRGDYAWWGGLHELCALIVHLNRKTAALLKPKLKGHPLVSSGNPVG